MDNPTSADPLRLQPPGAGLPWWELLVARHIIFPLSCRRMDWFAAEQLFQDEGARVLALWDALPADKRAERVLIRRLTGMEDSSRHWSAAMTVEHLNIVGNVMWEIINGLRRGETPARAARTQDVKPQGKTAPDAVRSQFALLLSESAASVATEPPMPPGQGLRAAHPWFGPLDAHQWHCLLGIHQQIHRLQMEAIFHKIAPSEGAPKRQNLPK